MARACECDDIPASAMTFLEPDAPALRYHVIAPALRQCGIFLGHLIAPRSSSIDGHALNLAGTGPATSERVGPTELLTGGVNYYSDCANARPQSSAPGACRAGSS